MEASYDIGNVPQQIDGNPITKSLSYCLKLPQNYRSWWMVKVQINIQGPYSAIKFKAIEKYERENKLINLTKNKYLFGQSSEKLDLNSTIVKKNL